MQTKNARISIVWMDSPYSGSREAIILSRENQWIAHREWPPWIRSVGRATVTSILTPSSTGNLLQLAGVSPTDKKAAAWLNDAFESARASYQTAKRRPLSADHNALLADIQKKAGELTERLERLRRHPASWARVLAL